MSRDCCPAAPTCFYCDVTLSVRHEHDHWPVAKRHDGATTVPVCLNCHDLKDRIPLDHWPSEALIVEAFAQCGPLGRLLLAKITGLMADRRRLEDAA
jgi:hypothetical protein